MNVVLIGIILLILEAGIIALLVKNMIKKRKLIEKSNLIYIAPVFVLIWAMHVLAVFYYNAYVGEISTSLISLLSLCKNTLETFVFAFDAALLSPIMNSSLIMLLAYSLMIVLASLTTILTLLSITNTAFKNLLKKRNSLKNNCDIILGVSEDAKKYNKFNPTSIIWDDKIETINYKDLINKGFVINNEILSIKTLLSKTKKGSHHFILFKDSCYNYSQILNLFEKVVSIKNEKLNKKFNKSKNKLIAKLKKENSNITQEEIENKVNQKLENLKQKNALFLHIESSIEEMEAIKEEFSSFVGTDINSFVTCFNKFQNIAMDFIKNNAISYNMPRDFFNDNYSLKEDKKVNVVFVGFGEVNSELFKLMAINFQFAKEKTKKTKLSKFENAPINYYVFDNNENRLNNDTFTKLEYEFEKMNSKILPKMEKICNLNHENTNVYSNKVKELLEKIIDENSYTYIIVAFKSDLENIAYSENLHNYLVNKQNYKIFTRVTESVFYEKPNAEHYLTFFGEEDILYSHNAITNKTLVELAQSIKSAHAQKDPKNTYYKWNNLILMHQYAKIYLVLNLIFNLGLMGYKLITKDELKKLSNYEIINFETFKENYTHIEKEEMKRDYNSYFKNLASNLMAFVLHSSWNAHYFLSGYKQMDVEEFAPKQDNKIGELKTHSIFKKHSSLTSYDGLDTLCKYIYLMKKYGKEYINYSIDDITTKELNSKEFMDIEQYSFDFRVLDFVENLTKQNYVLIKLKNNNDEI